MHLQFLYSSYQREVMGHRQTMLSDHHDEDRTNKARRVHGVSQKVSIFKCLRVNNSPQLSE